VCVLAWQSEQGASDVAKRVVVVGRIYGHSGIVTLDVEMTEGEAIGTIADRGFAAVVSARTGAEVEPLDLAFRRVDMALMDQVHESRRSRRG